MYAVKTKLTAPLNASTLPSASTVLCRRHSSVVQEAMPPPSRSRGGLGAGGGPLSASPPGCCADAPHSSANASVTATAELRAGARARASALFSCPNRFLLADRAPWPGSRHPGAWCAPSKGHLGAARLARRLQPTDPPVLGQAALVRGALAWQEAIGSCEGTTTLQRLPRAAKPGRRGSGAPWSARTAQPRAAIHAGDATVGRGVTEQGPKSAALSLRYALE